MVQLASIRTTAPKGRAKLPLCPDQQADERSDVGAD
jgi:hypothetical protein